MDKVDKEVNETERPRWYDKDGKPLTDLQDIGNKLGDINYKRVDLTNVGAGIEISTVWLGLDHSNFLVEAAEKPLIFETMIFDPNHGDFDEAQERYSTLEQAKVGHKKWVRFMRKQASRNV